MKPDELLGKVFESEVNTVRSREPPEEVLEKLRESGKNGGVQGRTGWRAFRIQTFEGLGIIAAALVCCITIVLLGRGETSAAEKEISRRVLMDAEEKITLFFETASRSL